MARGSPRVKLSIARRTVGLTRNHKMRIALPLTDSDEFSVHYGAASKFAVFDVDPKRRVVNRELIVVPQGSEPCQWPRLLRMAGTELLLAGGMGFTARRNMEEHAVKVLTGVTPAAPEAIVSSWLEGVLEPGANPCDGPDGDVPAGEGHRHASRCHCTH